jgi:hypothetical protein
MANGRTKRKSPYNRYSKTPCSYSQAYRAWRSATIAGKPREANDAARDHERQFNYRRYTVRYG